MFSKKFHRSIFVLCCLAAIRSQNIHTLIYSLNIPWIFNFQWIQWTFLESSQHHWAGMSHSYEESHNTTDLKVNFKRQPSHQISSIGNKKKKQRDMERPSISRQLAIITPHRQRWPLYSERCRHSAPLRNQRVFLTESQNCLEKKK